MRIQEDLESRGNQLPPIEPENSYFDSNCITLGTEFMARLAVCLQYYIHDQINTNPAWQNISVSLFVVHMNLASLLVTDVVYYKRTG